MNEDEIRNEIGRGIDDLSGAVEGAMVEISSQVGNATVEISRTMVESAREITEISQQFVNASGKLARAKAAQRFNGIMEEATLEHLMELSEKRASFEERAKALPPGPAKKYAMSMAEKIASEENKILEIAMSGGGLAGESGSIQSPVLTLPGTSPARVPGENRGEPFAPPPSVEKASDEIGSTPEIAEGGPGGIYSTGGGASSSTKD